MATITASATGGAYNTTGAWVGGVIPGSGDDVLLTATSGSINIPAATTVACNSLNCTGYTSTFTFTAATSVINIGSATAGLASVAVTFVSGMTLTLTGVGTINFISTSATVQTITTGGLTLPNYTINGAGSSYQLADSNTTVSAAVVTLTSGTLNTNGQTCSWGAFNSSNANTRTLTMGASAITFSGTGGGAIWQTTTITNLTITANTAVITSTLPGSFVSSALNLNGASVVLTGAGTYTMNCTLTYANFTYTGTAAKTNIVSLVGNQTATGTLTLTGSSAINRPLIQSSVPGTSRTISAATISLTNVDFEDITAAGAASPFTGTSLGDCLGNSNITFDSPVAQTWSGNTTGNWSTAANWTSRVPLPQDNVTVSGLTSGTITCDMARIGANVDFTGSTGGTVTTTTVVAVFGNLTYSTGVGISSASNAGVTFSGRGAQTITSAGRTQPGAVSSSFNVAAAGGSYTLQDAFTFAGRMTVSAGTFNSNNMTITCTTAASAILVTIAGTTLNLGTSTFNMNTQAGTVVALTSLLGTVNASSATFVIASASTAARTFAGNGNIFGTLTYNVANSPGSLTITGANTFNTINIGPGTQLIMPSSVTNTISSGGSFNVNGVNNGYLYVPGVVGNYASTPDAAPLQITGNLTLDCKCALPSWTAPAVQGAFVSKLGASGAFSYQFYILATGKLTFQCSSTGSATITYTSSVAISSAANTVQWVRVSFVLSNGSNSVAQFFTSPDGTTWTQLGTNITGAIVASIFNGTAPVEIGSDNAGASNNLTMSVYEARIFNSALGSGSGTPVFDANFATKQFGANTFTESSSNAATVTINGALAQVGDGRVSLVSSTPGTEGTLSKSGAQVSCDYLSIQDSSATGGALWYAGAHSVRVSNSGGWIYTAPGGAFSPLLLSPSAWYDTTQLPVVADGTAMPNWIDVSGNSKHLLQGVGSLQPLYKTAVFNGLPTALFDGVNDFFATIGTVGGYTVFAVVNHTDGATFSNYRRIWSVGNDAQSEFGVISTAAYNGDGALKRGFSTANIYVNGVNTLNAATLSSARVVSAVADSLATQILFVGTYSGSGLQTLKGNLGEIIFYPTALSTANRKSVENYLSAKWGTPTPPGLSSGTPNLMMMGMG